MKLLIITAISVSAGSKNGGGSAGGGGRNNVAHVGR